MTPRLSLPARLGRVCIMVLGLGAAAVTPVTAADHRDGPRIANNSATTGNLDLNDLYVFQGPANRNNTVLILTCAPGAGVVSPNTFVPGGFYEFKVDNTGDAHEDLTLRFIFSDPDRFGRQAYHAFAISAASGNVQQLASGVTGRTARVRGGGQVTAGLFDDPFFFDFLAFMKFEDEVQAGASLADRFAPFMAPNLPNNFFANFNTLAIVLEVPRLKLQSTRKNPHIGVWIRTEINGRQFDRMGIPAVNTAANFAQPLLGLPDLKDLFNTLTPADDAALRGEAAKRIVLAYGNSQAKADALAAAVLPDILPFNTTSRAGFLNGRRLDDDVIDAELGLLSGGTITTDRVINDSVFRRGFPYLGAALPRSASRAAIKSIQESEELRGDADAN